MRHDQRPQRQPSRTRAATRVDVAHVTGQRVDPAGGPMNAHPVLSWPGGEARPRVRGWRQWRRLRVRLEASTAKDAVHQPVLTRRSEIWTVRKHRWRRLLD